MTRDLSEAKHADMRASLDALIRAGELARQVAISAGTGIAVVRDGRLVVISAEELRAKQFATRHRH